MQDILAALQSPDVRKRREAAQYLKQNGTVQVIPALIQALIHDEDEWVSIDVAQALGSIGDKRAIPALLIALKAEERLKKWKVEWDELPTIADKDQRYNKYLFLWETLAAEISDLRAAAAQSLGQIGHEEAIPGLIEALLDENDLQVREAAKQALKMIGTAEVLAALNKQSP
jgi:HEAT repeat protein